MKALTGMELFAPGDRVELSGHWEFKDGVTGTVRGASRLTQTRRGPCRAYYVEFDEPQYEDSGDGPYRGGVIESDSLSHLSEVGRRAIESFVSDSPSLPVVEVPFLAGISGALRRRSKALAHMAASATKVLAIDTESGSPVQRCDISIEGLGGRPIRVSVTVWEDGRAEIDVRQPSKKGWAFQWCASCWLSGLAGETIVTRLEESLVIATPSNRDGETSSRLERLWKESQSGGRPAN